MQYLFAVSSFLVCQLLIAVSLVHAQDNSPKHLELAAPDSTRYGFSYQGTSTNRETANFVFAATGNDLTLNLLAFDIDYDKEVSVLLNGAFMGYLPITANNETGSATLTFPVGSLVSGDNTLSFVQRKPGHPWGVTDLLLSECNAQCPGNTAPLSLDLLDSDRYGFFYEGTFANRESANFVFAANGKDLTLDLLAFDIDYDVEVSVLLNGAFMGYLPTTANNETSSVTLTFPADSLISGDNTLSFVQRKPRHSWGVTDLFLSECNGQCPANTAPLSLDLLDSDRYGFFYEGTFANRESANFVFAANDKDLTLDLLAFDIDYDVEVSVLLNGAFMGYLPTTANNETGSATLTFPANSLVSGDNTLSFVQRKPRHSWGVTNLLLSECNGQCPGNTTSLSLDLLDFDRYGFFYEGTFANRESANFVFAATGKDLTLDLLAFDINYDVEVSVLLNGALMGYLPTTESNETGSATLTFPADSLVSGDNTLSFVQRKPRHRWGISDLFLSESKSGIFVESNQIVSSSAGPMVLKGVNFEGSWKYSQGQNLDEVAKTGANSVRIVWNIWQDTDNLSLVLNSAIANGLLPILEIHDATIGHELSSLVGDVTAFREVVSWWVSEDVKNVLLPLQDQLIVNIANEAFRTDFGLEPFVDEYASAIQQLRDAGYTTHLIIDGPEWGQDYVGGVARLHELQKVDSNISLGVHMYTAFLAGGSIDEMFDYMSTADVPWIIGEFSIQTPGCSGELDYRKIMSLANQKGIGYQAWSWGHGNSDCPEMDMTVPNGDFANLTDWGRAVADDLADSPKYLISLVDPEQPENPDSDETSISIRARGDVGDEQFRLLIGGAEIQTYSVQSSFQTFTYVSTQSINAADIRIEYTETIWGDGPDPNIVVDYIEVNGTRYETESPTTFSTGTWLDGGITPGFGRGDTLHYNGYFQYDALMR